MNTILVLVVFATVLTTTYGLKCYVCNDIDNIVENSECGDTFEKDAHQNLLKECNASAGEVWCRKQKTGINNLVTRIERSCAAQCEDQTGAYVDRVDCCSEDGCNAGDHVTPVLNVLAICYMLFAIVNRLACNTMI